MLSRVFGFGRRSFDSLSEQEVLALAISSEEDDGRIYRAYADGLRDAYPASAKVFDEMAEEEDHHRAMLIEQHRQRFGETIPLIRREHVRGYYERKPDWLVRPLGLDQVRSQAEAMEAQAHRFYVEAAKRTTDASTRKLLGDLAAAEKGHESLARRLAGKHLTEDVRAEEDGRTAAVHPDLCQPGLAGLMDGSVSTLAPIFAAAFAIATPGRPSSSACRPRSAPVSRWASPRPPMTTANCRARLASDPRPRLGHHDDARRARPRPYHPAFHDGDDHAVVVVFFELWAIAFIQNRYMERVPARRLQVVLGGRLMLAAGILIGNAERRNRAGPGCRRGPSRSVMP